MHESTVNKDDALNPGGGGCRWEAGADPSTAICTPTNGGHDMIPSTTNAYGQFNLKPPKPDFQWNPLAGVSLTPAAKNATRSKPVRFRA
jgi:hypothetical protein